MAKTKKEKIDGYSLVLEVNGEEYKADGETFRDAILDINPKKFATKGNLRASKDGKTANLLMNITQMRKTFGVCGSTTRDIFIGFFNKRIEQLLK